MQLVNPDRVLCYIYVLRDDAMIKRNGARFTVNLPALTLEEFKREFYGKYFTADARSSLN